MLSATAKSAAHLLTRKALASVGALAGAGLLWSAPAFAGHISAGTLHAFCYGGTPACLDNGTVTPTTTNPPNFGFSISPGGETGDFAIGVLVPNNRDPSPFSLSFSITGTQGGPTNSSALSGTATLLNPAAWTSGFLASFLGFGASPANPLGAWLPTTQTFDPGATGYYVYGVNLGTNLLQGNSTELSGPLLDIGGSALPIGSAIVGFLEVGDDIGATANSGALVIEGSGPPHSVPEPGTLALFSAGLLGLGWLRWRKAV